MLVIFKKCAVLHENVHWCVGLSLSVDDKGDGLSSITIPKVFKKQLYPYMLDSFLYSKS